MRGRISTTSGEIISTLFDSINEEASDETIPEYDEKISMKIKNETNLDPPLVRHVRTMLHRC